MTDRAKGARLNRAGERPSGVLRDIRIFADLDTAQIAELERELEFVQVAGLPPHDWLTRRVERALAARPGKTQIAVRGPLVMQVLSKLEKQAAAR